MLVIYIFLPIFIPLSAMHQNMNTLTTLPKDTKNIIVHNLTTDKNCQTIVQNLHKLGKLNKSFLYLLTDQSFSKELILRLSQEHRSELSIICPHDTVFAAAYILNTKGARTWIKKEYLSDTKNFKFISNSYFNLLNKKVMRNEHIKSFITAIWPDLIPELICQRLYAISNAINEHVAPDNSFKKFVLSLMHGKLSHKFKPNLYNRPLFLAIRAYNNNNVSKFLKNGADPETRDPITSHTPLTTALWKNNLDAIPILFAFDANANNSDGKGKFPLDLAIDCAYFKNNVTAVNLILAGGANPDIILGEDSTPLLIAIEKALSQTFKNKDILLSLLNYQANPNLPSPRGSLPLKAALQDAELVKILTSFGADPNKVDPSGKSAFVTALLRGLSDSTGILIQAGADIYSPITSDGKTPLEVAQKRGEHVIAQYIQTQQEKDKKDLMQKLLKK